MDALRDRVRKAMSPADLADIRDFRLGEVTVSPSRRILSGSQGTVELQPRVMQVLVVLAEHPGQVISRETLFERCWGDVYVGDDSLNRVIAVLRKVAAEAGATFEIETIARTGYRLGGVGSHTEDAKAAASGLSRRNLTMGAAGLAGLAGVGAWALVRSAEERRFEQLLREGDEALNGDDDLFRPQKALSLYEEAVRLRPKSAPALGRLALAQSYFALEATPPRSTQAAVLASETMQRALAIDAREPNALMATFELQGSALDWWSRDQLLRKIIAIDPGYGMALGELSALLQSAGLVREAWSWNERLRSLAPVSQVVLATRAYHLWLFGQLADADNIMNQLRAQYPTSKWVWFSRFVLYALTSRPGAARSMLDTDPHMFRAGPETAMWRSCLDALEQRTAARTTKAIDACLAGARTSGDLGGQAVLVLCELGRVDSAFEIAEGYLLSRGSLVQPGQRPYGREPTDALHRINTKWLFMPPCRAMRADPRFRDLCDGVGLVEYWRRRGAEPDYLRTER
jgi:DNA-binding winged helix-turn-helix (wHTH) protein